MERDGLANCNKSILLLQILQKYLTICTYCWGPFKALESAHISEGFWSLSCNSVMVNPALHLLITSECEYLLNSLGEGTGLAHSGFSLL